MGRRRGDGRGADGNDARGAGDGGRGRELLRSSARPGRRLRRRTPQRTVRPRRPRPDAAGRVPGTGHPAALPQPRCERRPQRRRRHLPRAVAALERSRSAAARRDRAGHPGPRRPVCAVQAAELARVLHPAARPVHRVRTAVDQHHAAAGHRRRRHRLRRSRDAGPPHLRQPPRGGARGARCGPGGPEPARRVRHPRRAGRPVGVLPGRGVPCRRPPNCSRPTHPS